MYNKIDIDLFHPQIGISDGIDLLQEDKFIE
jgi:hypothetical protein